MSKILKTRKLDEGYIALVNNRSFGWGDTRDEAIQEAQRNEHGLSTLYSKLKKCSECKKKFTQAELYEIDGDNYCKQCRRVKLAYERGYYQAKVDHNIK